ncbi:MAG TPA: hypothetical protein VH142_08090 [Polyangiaceae bacterium]|nr:hypothetical protein [Polyangiaceae bacterium]
MSLATLGSAISTVCLRAVGPFGTWVVALFVVACGAAPTPAPSPPPSASASAPKTAVHARWERAGDVATWPEVRPPFPSRGHGVGFVVDIRVPSEELAEYRALVRGQSLRPGFVVAASHRDAGTGAPGPVYAMTKTASGEWSFVVATADGRTITRGALPLCARCHAEAPTDAVFTAGPGCASVVGGIPSKTQE